MRKILPFIFGTMVLLSCSNESKKPAKSELAKQLEGPWSSIAMKVKMNSYNNTDSTRLFEVFEKEWEKKMQIKPIKTFFKEDGTYYSEHRNLRDSLFFRPAGRWSLFNDSLVMTDTFPQKGKPFIYKISIRQRLIEMRSMEDCDGDGKMDDEYYGALWKQDSVIAVKQK